MLHREKRVVTQNGVVGSVIGDRYRVEALIGSGGVASVYRAKDELLGRRVALKLIPGAADDDALQRERSEIELLASLNHPALVTLHDVSVFTGEQGESTCLVMELVDGPTLGERITAGPLDAADIRRMAVDIAGALHLVHARGIVHRDIKPGNVLLAPSSMPEQEFSAKLADFGIAYLVDATRLTATGILLGTAAYVSPEQALGKPPGPPTDIYALGLVLLESLTRERAFTGSVAESLATRITADPIIPSSIGTGWHGLLTWMTSRAPEDRPTAIGVAAAATAIDLGADAQPDPDAPTEAIVGSTVEFEHMPTDSMPTEHLQPESPQPEQLEPTRVMLAAGAPTSATEVLRPSAPARSDAAPSDPAPAGAAPTSSPSRRPSRRAVALIAGAIGVILIAAIAIAVSQNAAPEASTDPSTGTSVVPDLPALDDPLGGHLDDLLEAING